LLVNFNEYQEQALLTDQFGDRKRGDNALMVPLLGLAGEAGTLLSEFKKKIRDRESYEGFKDRAREELGDVLWYLASIASHLGLTMDDVATQNLRKTHERWPIAGGRDEPVTHLDDEYPESEWLPRRETIRIAPGTAGRVGMWLVQNDEPVGNELSDNAHEDDGYRFHDVFHIANWAVLGWSPVMRKLLNRKRRSRPEIDEVEDGARAGILEELIVAFVYANAAERKFYDGVARVDTELLTTVKRLVTKLEVGAKPMRAWEQAILQGYAAFRYLRRTGSGTFVVDMDARQLSVVP
jgi:NTP pyrophosphatase (non-canonical NTP hydrolase)